jgi:8-oxo-dGTP diphosphatase
MPFIKNRCNSDFNVLHAQNGLLNSQVGQKSVRSGTRAMNRFSTTLTLKSYTRRFTCSDEYIETMLLKSVDVVVGIILNGNKFLVERRRLDEKVDPGIVCLPGGHVKTDESKEEALKRELREELGINVKRLKFICKNFYIASNGEKQNAYCYLVTDYEGKPVCNLAQEIFWEAKIENLSLEVDRKTIMRLRELIDPPE